jgi:hypothetical protein
MWANIAKEMDIPLEAAKVMVSQLGEKDIARRASELRNSPSIGTRSY